MSFAKMLLGGVEGKIIFLKRKREENKEKKFILFCIAKWG